MAQLRANLPTADGGWQALSRQTLLSDGARSIIPLFAPNLGVAIELRGLTTNTND